MRLTTIVRTLLGLALGVAGALAFGALRWKVKTKAFRLKLEAARLPASPTTYDSREIEGLPPPVRRYFRAVLKEGQPVVVGVRLSQEGEFRQSDAEDSWRPFKATQVFTIRPPGFDWDARISAAPVVQTFVRDAYTAGTGILHAALLGLFTVADVRGTPEIARGELLRCLGERAWSPTALLPSQGVRWEAMDDSTARATLSDGAVSVSLEFRFDQEGLITSTWAPLRHRAVNGVLQPLPWQGRFNAYADREGMRIPLEAEVEWILPEGTLPYWRGRITEIEFQLAR